MARGGVQKAKTVAPLSNGSANKSNAPRGAGKRVGKVIADRGANQKPSNSAVKNTRMGQGRAEGL